MPPLHHDTAFYLVLFCWMLMLMRTSHALWGGAPGEGVCANSPTHALRTSLRHYSFTVKCYFSIPRSSSCVGLSLFRASLVERHAHDTILFGPCRAVASHAQAVPCAPSPVIYGWLIVIVVPTFFLAVHSSPDSC